MDVCKVVYQKAHEFQIDVDQQIDGLNFDVAAQFFSELAAMGNHQEFYDNVYTPMEEWFYEQEEEEVTTIALRETSLLDALSSGSWPEQLLSM